MTAAAAAAAAASSCRRVVKKETEKYNENQVDFIRKENKNWTSSYLMQFKPIYPSKPQNHKTYLFI